MFIRETLSGNDSEGISVRRLQMDTRNHSVFTWQRTYRIQMNKIHLISSLAKVENEQCAYGTLIRRIPLELRNRTNKDLIYLLKCF